MKHEAIPLALDQAGALERLERLVQREREGRLQAEAIAERGLRELYDSQVRLALLQLQEEQMVAVLHKQPELLYRQL